MALSEHETAEFIAINEFFNHTVWMRAAVRWILASEPDHEAFALDKFALRCAFSYEAVRGYVLVKNY